MHSLPVTLGSAERYRKLSKRDKPQQRSVQCLVGGDYSPEGGFEILPFPIYNPTSREDGKENEVKEESVRRSVSREDKWEQERQITHSNGTPVTKAKIKECSGMTFRTPIPSRGLEGHREERGRRKSDASIIGRIYAFKEEMEDSHRPNRELSRENQGLSNAVDGQWGEEEHLRSKRRSPKRRRQGVSSCNSNPDRRLVSSIAGEYSQQMGVNTGHSSAFYNDRIIGSNAGILPPQWPYIQNNADDRDFDTFSASLDMDYTQEELDNALREGLHYPWMPVAHPSGQKINEDIELPTDIDWIPLSHPKALAMHSKRYEQDAKPVRKSDLLYVKNPQRLSPRKENIHVDRAGDKVVKSSNRVSVQYPSQPMVVTHHRPETNGQTYETSDLDLSQTATATQLRGTGRDMRSSMLDNTHETIECMLNQHHTSKLNLSNNYRKDKRNFCDELLRQSQIQTSTLPIPGGGDTLPIPLPMESLYRHGYNFPGNHTLDCIESSLMRPETLDDKVVRGVRPDTLELSLRRKEYKSPYPNLYESHKSVDVYVDQNANLHHMSVYPRSTRSHHHAGRVDQIRLQEMMLSATPMPVHPACTTKHPPQFMSSGHMMRPAFPSDYRERYIDQCFNSSINVSQGVMDSQGMTHVTRGVPYNSVHNLGQAVSHNPVHNLVNNGSFHNSALHSSMQGDLQYILSGVGARFRTNLSCYPHEHDRRY